MFEAWWFKRLKEFFLANVELSAWLLRTGWSVVLTTAFQLGSLQMVWVP